MKLFTFLVIMFSAIVSCDCQNLIGYNSTEIKNYMNNNRKDMNIEKVVNKSFRYLKYSDKNDTQTILFFLNPDSVCNNIRMICNNSIRSSKVKEMDSVFIKRGENTWTDKRSGKSYLVKLVDDEWSFTITIQTEK
jgi:hypothetical protein